MNYHLLTDDELTDLLKTSDEKAFKEIYARYWKEMFLVAYRKTGNRELSEELLQNIFLSLWQNRETVAIKTLPAYLFNCVRFSVINHIKSQLVKEKYLEYKMNVAGCEAASCDERLLIHDLADAIEKGVALLPQKTQEVFILSRFENHTVREIAGKLKISEKAVEYHITRSLKTMRYYLKDFLLLLLLCFFF